MNGIRFGKIVAAVERDFRSMSRKLDRQEKGWRWLLRNSVSNNGDRYEPRFHSKGFR